MYGVPSWSTVLVWCRFERSEIRIARMRARSASARLWARARWRSSAVDRVAASMAPSTAIETVTRTIALTSTSTSAKPACSPASLRTLLLMPALSMVNRPVLRRVATLIGS